MIEIEHFEKTFAANLMQITVGQCTYIGRRLADCIAIFTPKIIAKYIVRTYDKYIGEERIQFLALTENRKNFIVLNDLQRTGDDKTEHIETFTRMIEHITGCRVIDMKMYS